MQLLDIKLTDEDKKLIVNTIKSFWNQETGGFGGGKDQMPHLAPTYASVLALASVGKVGYDCIDRYFYLCLHYQLHRLIKIWY